MSADVVQMAKAEGPKLTTEQKQAIRIAALEMDNARLRHEAANAAFNRAIQDVRQDGYELNQQLDYVRSPDPSVSA
jgi:hypothetical protein